MNTFEFDLNVSEEESPSFSRIFNPKLIKHIEIQLQKAKIQNDLQQPRLFRKSADNSSFISSINVNKSSFSPITSCRKFIKPEGPSKNQKLSDINDVKAPAISDCQESLRIRMIRKTIEKSFIGTYVKDPKENTTQFDQVDSSKNMQTGINCNEQKQNPMNNSKSPRIIQRKKNKNATDRFMIYH